VVTIRRSGSDSDETITLADEKYTILNVRSDIAVTISGIVANSTIRPFIVDGEMLSSVYLAGPYNDIIFKDGGELTIDTSNDDAGGLTPQNNGVVKVLKTFESDQWYAVGFPFDIASVRCDIAEYNYDLQTYKPNGTNDDRGDYWLKIYKGVEDKFYYYDSGATELEAGGYALQVPDALDGAEFTFTASSGVVLSNSATPATEDGGYILTANPSVAGLTITPSEPVNYYCYEYTKKSNFGLLETGNYTLKPFESLVVARNITGGLRSGADVEETGTSSEVIRPEGEQPVAIQYYNLQGMEVSQPLKGNIYVVKKSYKNQASECTKIILK
jgi:hypothetical protein